MDETYPLPTATEGKVKEVNLAIIVFSTQRVLDQGLKDVLEFLEQVPGRTLHVNVQSAFDFPTAKAMIDLGLSLWPDAIRQKVQTYDHGTCPDRMPKGAVFLELLQDKVLERFVDK